MRRRQSGVTPFWNLQRFVRRAITRDGEKGGAALATTLQEPARNVYKKN